MQTSRENDKLKAFFKKFLTSSSLSCDDLIPLKDLIDSLKHEN